MYTCPHMETYWEGKEQEVAGRRQQSGVRTYWKEGRDPGRRERKGRGKGSEVKKRAGN